MDELVIVTWTYDAAPRHRSYELIARAFDLEGSMHIQNIPSGQDGS